MPFIVADTPGVATADAHGITDAAIGDVLVADTAKIGACATASTVVTTAMATHVAETDACRSAMVA